MRGRGRGPDGETEREKMGLRGREREITHITRENVLHSKTKHLSAAFKMLN